MNLELTKQQSEIVNGHEGQPIEVVDPDTKRSYLLVAREQSDKICSQMDGSSLAPASSSHLPAEVSAGIRRSQEAFWRDLPELLRQRKRGQWACYCGNEQIGVARNDAELYRLCRKRGLKQSEFYIGHVEEHSMPPWEPEVLEESLFEAVNIDLPAEPAKP